MLRRLRLKFILTNMLLVTLVLLAVFGALMLSTARQLERESGAVLTMVLRKDGIPPQFEVRPPDSGEGGDRGRRSHSHHGGGAGGHCTVHQSGALYGGS